MRRRVCECAHKRCKVFPTRPNLNTSVLKWKRVSGIPAGRPAAGWSMISRKRCSRAIRGRVNNRNVIRGWSPPAARNNRMHTWLAVLRRLSSARKNPAKFLTAALTLFLLHASTAFAQPSEAGGEANLQLPDLSSVSFLGMNGTSLLTDRPALLRLRTAVRPGDLHAAEEPAGSSLHARNLRADLRDLQDLPGHAGQVHDDPVGFHRGHHPCLLRLAGAGSGQADRA